MFFTFRVMAVVGLLVVLSAPEEAGNPAQPSAPLAPSELLPRASKGIAVAWETLSSLPAATRDEVLRSALRGSFDTDRAGSPDAARTEDQRQALRAGASYVARP